jgi:hypothetical protein
MTTRDKTRTFHIIAILLWVSAIPVVIALYLWFPSNWLEILGLTLSVGHFWSILAAHLNALLATNTEAPRDKALYENDITSNTVVEAVYPSTVVDCESTTVWA